MKEFFENFLMPTKTIYSMWVIMAVILLFSIIATRKMKDVPGPLQNIAEMAVGGLLNFFAGVLGEKKARHYFPMLGVVLRPDHRVQLFGTYSRIGRSVHGPYIGADGNGGAVDHIFCRHPVVRHKKARPWQIPRHVLQAICVPVPDPDPRTVYASAFHGIATLRQYLRRRACSGNAV